MRIQRSHGDMKQKKKGLNLGPCTMCAPIVDRRTTELPEIASPIPSTTSLLLSDAARIEDDVERVVAVTVAVGEDVGDIGNDWVEEEFEEKELF